MEKGKLGKWELLRRALNGKKDLNDPNSIHRHNGYKVIQKKSIVWFWRVEYHINRDTTWDNFLSKCRDLTRLNDTSQLVLLITADLDGYANAMEIIDKFVQSDLGRVKKLESKETSSVSPSSGTLDAELYFIDNQFQPKLPVCRYYQWTLPVVVGTTEPALSSLPCVFTRENLPDAGIKLNDLFSHRVHGVDNTGNVKVWEAESILTYVLLTQPEYFHHFRDKRVLELGGGSTGLCGLSIASSQNHSCREVVITDGHPDCVFNQNICLQMCLQQKSILPHTTVSCSRLLWQRNDPNHELHSILFPPSAASHVDTPQLFDCIIASDCMFFKDFHKDLLWVLNTALAEHGVIYMLQPKRGDTMDRFLSFAREFFAVSIHEDYSATITELHNQYVEEAAASLSSSLYDPDIHYPVLVILRKLSSLREESIDLEMIR